ncbi:hypothetical protein [Telmatospirillum sp. J64-1]|uniref:hypothetical protein n=1 Tax=Telmatospirillum sp. J64-1 TaxID=2502183 RepID=UPI00115C65F8|nr:hypothetical protein [Telmatospirillum sp. J64-1]
MSRSPFRTGMAAAPFSREAAAITRRERNHEDGLISRQGNDERIRERIAWFNALGLPGIEKAIEERRLASL